MKRLKCNFLQLSLRATEGSEAISGRDCFGASRLAMTIVSICIILFSWEISLAQESQDLYLAQKAFADGFYEIALSHFQKYLEANPDTQTAEVQIFIARCHLALSQFAQSLQMLEKLLSKATKTPQVYDEAVFWKAKTYFAAKDYENALQNFAKILENPNSKFLPESYFYKAACFYNRKEFNQALKSYQEFNKQFPKHKLNEESNFRIAQCFYNVKNYPEAHKEFAKFAKSLPESEYANATFHYLGEIEYILGNFEEAIDYYTKAYQVQPKGKIAALARYSRGWAYLKLKSYRKALDEFNDLKESPGLGPALSDSIIFAQGRSLALLQNYPEAIQNYDRLINEFSHSSWFDDAYFWKGQALYELGKYTEACKTYEEAMAKFSQKTQEFRPDQTQAIYEREDFSTNLLPNLRYNLGWTYARLKKYSEAIEQFTMAFEDSDERFLKSGALCRIGDIYLEQGNFREASKNYDTVLKDFSDSYYADYAQYQLGVALSREKRFDAAILAFNALIANFAQSKYIDEAQFQIAAIYFQQGLFLEAQQKLKDLIEQLPQGHTLKAQATFLKASASFNNKDYLQARDEFLEVLRITDDVNLKMQAQYQIAFCLYQMQEEEKALRQFDKFLAQYPNTELAGEVIFWLGQYYFRQKQFAQAEKYFTNFQQQFLHSELADEAKFWQAKALFMQGNNELALENLNKLEEDEPNSDILADALLLKGDIFKDRGDFAQAKEAYKMVYTKFGQTPFSRIAHQKTAELLYAQKLFSQAIEQYASALGSESTDFNAQIQFAIAQCWEGQEDFSRALDEYLKVGYVYPSVATWSSKAQLKSAQILERQQQLEQARRIYEKLAKEDTPEAEFARDRLKTLEKD